jgi:hypothetical protein
MTIERVAVPMAMAILGGTMISGAAPAQAHPIIYWQCGLSDDAGGDDGLDRSTSTLGSSFELSLASK